VQGGAPNAARQLLGVSVQRCSTPCVCGAASASLWLACVFGFVSSGLVCAVILHAFCLYVPAPTGPSICQQQATTVPVKGSPTQLQGTCHGMELNACKGDRSLACCYCSARHAAVAGCSMQQCERNVFLRIFPQCGHVLVALLAVLFGRACERVLMSRVARSYHVLCGPLIHEPRAKGQSVPHQFLTQILLITDWRAAALPDACCTVPCPV
jgi:hypothetical protein